MESSRTEDLLLDKADLEQFDNECGDIYTFTQREVALIYTSLRFADWDARWVNRERDSELVETVKRKLLMLCVRDLVRAQLLTVSALAGLNLDLSTDEAIETYLSTQQDFTEIGVRPAIDRLSGASEEEDYTDELSAIATILGAAI